MTTHTKTTPKPAPKRGAAQPPTVSRVAAQSAPRGSASRWKSRIVGEANVSPKDLVTNLLNWRKHSRSQQAAMGGALDEIGWIQRVIVNKRNGNIIDGHLRVELALKQKENAVPVCYVDLSPEEERIALATFDSIGALAVTDQKVLDELLASINSENEDPDALLGVLGAPASGGGTGAGTKEIDPNLFGLEHKCPRCGFEFNGGAA